MSNLQATQPIGVFDSGVGGLTIARAIKNRLPNESLVYFGDTAHLPYGEKSPAAIQAYAVRIADWLLKKQCKMIVIACNSASAVAFDLVREYVDGRAHVVNVIDPVVQHLHQAFVGRHVGLIATRPTVNSNVYADKLKQLEAQILLSAHATPLLAAAIEEDFQNPALMQALLKEYLSHPSLRSIDALLLACTHYPVISEDIAAYYEQRIDIISPPALVAEAVAQVLKQFKLSNPEDHVTPDAFYFSDYTEAFARMTQRFFGESISLKVYPLWGE